MGPDRRYDHAEENIENIDVGKERFFESNILSRILSFSSLLYLYIIGGRRLLLNLFFLLVFQPRPGRRPRGRPGNAAQLHTAPRIQSPISQHLEKGRHSLNIRQGWRNYLGYYFFFFF